jgi:pyruvate dehydrogenase E2 component (dihydrolipoamide acetyltransferase)
MAYEFRFPDVGEGISEGELLSWRVKEGDQVAQDQTLAEMETDKAVVEMPSPRPGRVLKLHAAEGDIVNVGDVLVTIEEASTLAVEAPRALEEAAQPAPQAAQPAPEPYTGSVVGRLEEAPEEEEEAAAPRQVAPASEEPDVLAMPSIRALARELGVDLKGLRGTGPGGRIIKQDVEDTAQSLAYGAAVSGAAPAPPLPAPGKAAEGPSPVAPTREGEAGLVPVLGGVIEHDAHGPVERVLFRGVRRSMAHRMAEAVAKQAQVTTMDEADVTIIKRIREKERTVAAERGVRLTYLAFVVKACTASLKRFPRLNAVLEESGEEFLLKRYYNIGIAIDTRSGLMVPNIKDADRKSIFQIAEEIIDLVNRAEERRIDLQGFRGGTFSITNYGAIGGLYATPVINYPEVAILGMGRVREMPAVREGKIVTRLALPLALTFDHRLVDGAEATRFLNLVIGYLEDPDLLLLEGA